MVDGVSEQWFKLSLPAGVTNVKGGSNRIAESVKPFKAIKWGPVHTVWHADCLQTDKDFQVSLIGWREVDKLVPAFPLQWFSFFYTTSGCIWPQSQSQYWSAQLPFFLFIPSFCHHPSLSATLYHLFVFCLYTRVEILTKGPRAS